MRFRSFNGMKEDVFVLKFLFRSPADAARAI